MKPNKPKNNMKQQPEHMNLISKQQQEEVNKKPKEQKKPKEERKG